MRCSGRDMPWVMKDMRCPDRGMPWVLLGCLRTPLSIGSLVRISPEFCQPLVCVDSPICLSFSNSKTLHHPPCSFHLNNHTF